MQGPTAGEGAPETEGGGVKGCFVKVRLAHDASCSDNERHQQEMTRHQVQPFCSGLHVELLDLFHPHAIASTVGLPTI